MFKRLSVSILFLFVAEFSKAQFYTALLPSPDFNNALEKIVSDFRYNFKNIISDTLSTEGEVDTYSSKVQLPGTNDCVITKYHSVRDTSASFVAVAYKGDNYKEAVKAYKNAFRLINKSRMQLIDRSIISFTGELRQPTEEIRFTVSSLHLDVDDIRYKRFTAEVELLANYTDWQVNINLSNKKPDNERE